MLHDLHALHVPGAPAHTGARTRVDDGRGDGGPAAAPRARGESPGRPGLPPPLAWLWEEAGLRPPAVARLLGVAPDVLARWGAGAGAPGSWAPAPTEVPLLAALAAVQARVAAALPDASERVRWWAGGRRTLGWLSPAELLRRGKLGEVLLLVADPGAFGAPGRDP